MMEKKEFLYPAAMFTSNEPYIVDTILGSCVAVCLYDTRLKIGGVNHYMLPYWNGQGLASPKYGNIAIPKLLEKLQSMGSKNEDLIAKVFGGANMFETEMEQFMIGDRNIAVAMEILTEKKIKIGATSTGGNKGRKIRYNTATGEVLQRMIEKQMLATK